MSSASSIRAARYCDQEDMELCRTLIREYAEQRNAGVGGEHFCVVSLHRELAQLPVPYVPPSGALLAGLC